MRCKDLLRILRQRLCQPSCLAGAIEQVVCSLLGLVVKAFPLALLGRLLAYITAYGGLGVGPLIPLLMARLAVLRLLARLLILVVEHVGRRVLGLAIQNRLALLEGVAPWELGLAQRCVDVIVVVRQLRVHFVDRLATWLPDLLMLP